MGGVVAIIVPVFGLMLTGFVFAKTRLIEPAGMRGLSVFVFNVAIPALLFRSLASASGPESAVGAGVAYAYFTGCLAVFFIAMALGRFWLKQSLEQQALVAIHATFSNSVQLGIPIIFLAFGRAGEAPILLIIAFHTIILISLTTVLVEIGLGRGKGALSACLAVARALVKNPIILAILAGDVWSRLGFPVAGPFDEFLKLFAAAASPCALFVLGASLAELRLSGAVAECMAVAALKLVLLPATIWALARFAFALPPVETAVATIVAATPTGANAFMLAQRYDLYTGRSAAIVLITTALSVATLSLCLVAFRGAS
jgi:malonate transporter